jgi:hypothetical protein
MLTKKYGATRNQCMSRTLGADNLEGILLAVSGNFRRLLPQSGRLTMSSDLWSKEDSRNGLDSG